MSILLAVKSHIACAWSLLPATAVAAIALPLATTPAEAHVKWFAPYIVGTTPQPIMATLTNSWFWLAIALVLTVFIATRFVERTMTCHGIFPPPAIRVRPIERTDDEEGTTDGRADHWHLAGA